MSSMGVPNCSARCSSHALMAGQRFSVRGETYWPSSSNPPWQRTPPQTRGSATLCVASSSSSVQSSCIVVMTASVNASVYTWEVPRDAGRRESILGAAARAFVEHGFASTSMDDVAGHAGISRLIVYRHFSSKEALYVAVLERVSERLGEAFTDAFAVVGRPGGAAVAAVMQVAREDPDAFTLLWRHAAREPRFAVHAESFRRTAVEFTESLLAGIDLGGRRQRRWAAETLVTYVIGGVLHWLEEGRPDGDPEVVERITTSLPVIIGAWAMAPVAPVTAE